MKRIAFLLTLVMLLATCFIGCNNTENIHQNDDTTVNTTDAQPNSEPHSNNDEHYLCIENDYTTGKKYAVWALKTFELSLSDQTHTAYLETATFGEYAWIFDVRAKGIILYKLSASGEMEVYENIYPEDIGFTEMTFAFASFYNETNGCLFFWRDDCYVSGWPIRFLKTNDGGKTWNLYEPENAPTTSCEKQYPNFAKFLLGNVGIVSYRYYTISDLCARTYLTFDGGKTWEHISQLEYSQELSDYVYSEVKDLYYTSSGYILEVEISNGKLGTKDIVYYISQNLKLWELFSNN